MPSNAAYSRFSREVSADYVSLLPTLVTRVPRREAGPGPGPVPRDDDLVMVGSTIKTRSEYLETPRTANTAYRMALKEPRSDLADPREAYEAALSNASTRLSAALVVSKDERTTGIVRLPLYKGREYAEDTEEDDWLALNDPRVTVQKGKGDIVTVRVPRDVAAEYRFFPGERGWGFAFAANAEGAFRIINWGSHTTMGQESSSWGGQFSGLQHLGLEGPWAPRDGSAPIMSKVTSLAAMFVDCRMITSLEEIKAWDISEVT